MQGRRRTDHASLILMSNDFDHRVITRLGNVCMALSAAALVAAALYLALAS